MAITEAAFDSEAELHGWVCDHIGDFLPQSELIAGFQITTISGKSGVPDGFAFNFQDREWYLIETELLKHGVWPHIAEQITRFVVAMQNPEATRKVGDKIFEHLLEAGKADQAASSPLKKSA